MSPRELQQLIDLEWQLYRALTAPNRAWSDDGDAYEEIELEGFTAGFVAALAWSERREQARST